jgi:hypothetical protein
MNTLPLGPLMIDVAGLELTDAERERLAIRWSAASSCSSATIAIRSSSPRCAPRSTPCAARPCRSPSTTKAAACSAAAKASPTCRRCAAWATCGTRDPGRRAQGRRRPRLPAGRRTARLRRRLFLHPGARPRLGPQRRHRRPRLPQEPAGRGRTRRRPDRRPARRRHGLLRQALPRPRLGRRRFAPRHPGRRAQPRRNGARPHALPPPHGSTA